METKAFLSKVIIDKTKSSGTFFWKYWYIDISNATIEK